MFMKTLRQKKCHCIETLKKTDVIMEWPRYWLSLVTSTDSTSGIVIRLLITNSQCTIVETFGLVTNSAEYKLGGSIRYALELVVVLILFSRNGICPCKISLLSSRKFVKMSPCPVYS